MKTTPESTPFSRARRQLPLILIACGAIAGALFLRDVLDFQALADNRERLLALRDAHYPVAVAGFILAYATLVTFSLPGATVATLTGGFLFETFPGVLFNMTGATIGAAILFLAARKGLGDRLAAKMDASEGRIARIKAGIDANQWEMLFLIRLIPVVPFFVANLLPALVGVPFGRFVLTTFVGIIPGALVYTSVGAGLGEIFEQGGTPDLTVIFSAEILLPLLGLAALAALPAVIRMLRKTPEV
ncbi:TVP38/TMEM64 family protein [Donghicola mangrovi]|uniref:TVP38/TMEM64 family membrane protein n=1 Tax=Donghicola mangrovi TaxID=2729614 RepID=A0A850PYS4_9RHOB|nr:TVP38/TMEM64 family protein [Donghicola mangrovi]NVO21894.1 TVP38/TMEM64 family protein [Donghicola mangrovi]